MRSNEIKIQKNSGFTLIELLVVVAIIGLLATVIVLWISNQVFETRVKQRATNLLQVQKALELYYTNNNSYPSTVRSGWLYVRSECDPYDDAGNDVIPNFTQYLSAVPRDPLKPDPTDNLYDYCYFYISNGTDYKFGEKYVLEYDSNSAPLLEFPALIDPARDCGTNPSAVETQNLSTCWGPGIAVYTPGAASWSW